MEEIGRTEGGGGVAGRGSAGLSGFLCASLGNIRRACRRVFTASGEYRVASEGFAALCVVFPALEDLREPSAGSGLTLMSDQRL